MASREVSGKTVQELAELEFEFEKKPRAAWYEFEDYYCLAGPLRQPDDYDGPDRYCSQVAEANGRCRFHGGKNPAGGRPENLDPLANLKHSMYASEDTIRETMTDDERQLYDWIMSWAEVYGIDPDADPSAYDDLRTLAVERVRQERSSDYILAKQTEVTEEGVYTSDGQLLETREVPHSLIDSHQSQIRLIQKIKDTLGITRKAQQKGEQAETAMEVMDGFAGALSDLISGDDGDYDPDDFKDN